VAGVIVADASVIIAAANPAEVHHERARAILREAGEAGVVLHSLTMAEVLVGPARSGAQDVAHAAFAAAGIRSSSATDPPPTALALVRASAALKMPDACVLATAEHLAVPLATFDERLVRAAAARGVTVVDSAG
jgi:predicted nucleic acid-binding protein